MRVRAGGVLGLKTVIGGAIVQPGRAVPCLDLHQHFRQIPVRSRAAHHRDMRRALKNLLAFLLGHASQNAEFLALRLQFLVVGQPVKDLLLRLVADGASVVENQTRFFDSRHLPIPLLQERADHLFGVVHIHLTAESLEVKRFVRGPRHPFQYKTERNRAADGSSVPQVLVTLSGTSRLAKTTAMRNRRAPTQQRNVLAGDYALLATSRESAVSPFSRKPCNQPSTRFHPSAWLSAAAGAPANPS